MNYYLAAVVGLIVIVGAFVIFTNPGVTGMFTAYESTPAALKVSPTPSATALPTATPTATPSVQTLTPTPQEKIKVKKAAIAITNVSFEPIAHPRVTEMHIVVLNAGTEDINDPTYDVKITDENGTVVYERKDAVTKIIKYAVMKPGESVQDDVIIQQNMPKPAIYNFYISIRDGNDPTVLGQFYKLFKIAS